MISRTEHLQRLMTGKGLKLSLAESCTGGMIGSEITSLPGSSSFFMGSAVTYSNESKESILSVSHDRKYLSEVCDKIYRLTPEGLRAQDLLT